MNALARPLPDAGAAAPVTPRAAGLASASRVVGSTLGVAVAGTLVTVSFWWILAGCGVVVLGLGVALRGTRA